MRRGPQTLTPYYRRASGCDRQEDIDALCVLRAARCTTAKVSREEKNGPLNYIPIGSHAE
jgi:hypothetical protein